MGGWSQGSHRLLTRIGDFVAETFFHAAQAAMGSTPTREEAKASSSAATAVAAASSSSAASGTATPAAAAAPAPLPFDWYSDPLFYDIIFEVRHKTACFRERANLFSLLAYSLPLLLFPLSLLGGHCLRMQHAASHCEAVRTCRIASAANRARGARAG